MYPSPVDPVAAWLSNVSPSQYLSARAPVVIYDIVVFVSTGFVLRALLM